MKNDNNELITWTNKLECGMTLIDEQHKRFVDLVNGLFCHVTGNEAQEHDYFNKVIKETVRYIKIHFATEEKIMFVTQFEGYAEHKKEHESFLLAVIDKIHDYEVGNRLTLSAFTIFIKDWLLSHIVLIDKQYFEYLRKIATIKPNGKLTVSMNP